MFLKFHRNHRVRSQFDISYHSCGDLLLTVEWIHAVSVTEIMGQTGQRCFSCASTKPCWSRLPRRFLGVCPGISFMCGLKGFKYLKCKKIEKIPPVSPPISLTKLKYIYIYFILYSFNSFKISNMIARGMVQWYCRSMYMWCCKRLECMAPVGESNDPPICSIFVPGCRTPKKLAKPKPASEAERTASALSDLDNILRLQHGRDEQPPENVCTPQRRAGTATGDIGDCSGNMLVFEISGNMFRFLRFPPQSDQNIVVVNYFVICRRRRNKWKAPASFVAPFWEGPNSRVLLGTGGCLALLQAPGRDADVLPEHHIRTERITASQRISPEHSGASVRRIGWEWLVAWIFSHMVHSAHKSRFPAKQWPMYLEPLDSLHSFRVPVGGAHAHPSERLRCKGRWDSAADGALWAGRDSTIGQPAWIEVQGVRSSIQRQEVHEKTAWSERLICLRCWGWWWLWGILTAVAARPESPSDICRAQVLCFGCKVLEARYRNLVATGSQWSGWTTAPSNGKVVWVDGHWQREPIHTFQATRWEHARIVYRVLTAKDHSNGSPNTRRWNFARSAHSGPQPSCQPEAPCQIWTKGYTHASRETWEVRLSCETRAWNQSGTIGGGEIWVGGPLDVYWLDCEWKPWG